MIGKAEQPEQPEGPECHRGPHIDGIMYLSVTGDAGKICNANDETIQIAPMFFVPTASRSHTMIRYPYANIQRQ